MSQPAENPCSDVEECEQTVRSIWQILYKTLSRMFTTEVLTRLETNLADVIEILVNTQEICIPSKYEVLHKLKEAQDELGLAINELVDKGISRKFTTCLRKCREHLEGALEVWNDGS